MLPRHFIGDALLRRIQATAGGDGATIPTPLRQLTGGFDTETYDITLSHPPTDWPTHLILRLFPAGSSPQRANFEAAAQTAVVSQGFPCPAVYHRGDDLFATPGSAPTAGENAQRPFLIMDRMPGVPILDAALGASTLIFRASGILANLLADLYELDPAPFAAALGNALTRPADRLQSLSRQLNGHTIQAIPTPTPAPSPMSPPGSSSTYHRTRRRT